MLTGTDVPILNLASWPPAEDLELDDSQYRAIQMALTKEFAIIQGPPGTGKTYIGLKVDDSLKENESEKLLWVEFSHTLKLEHGKFPRRFLRIKVLKKL